MSRFSGPQFRGAKRQMRLDKRAEAEARQVKHDKRQAELAKVLVDVVTDEPFVGFDK